MKKVVFGAQVLPFGGCAFRIFAPSHRKAEVVLEGKGGRFAMRRNGHGWFECLVDEPRGGTRYRFLLSGKKTTPDPASAHQPEGVFGPSEVVDHSSFHWGDEPFADTPPCNAVLYEMHVGAFTPEGTFDAAADRLHVLRDMGFTGIQLLPITQFSGRWNWGFAGVFPYAVHAGYGGPEGLKRFVRTARSYGLSVFLDMAFGRLWSEGSVLANVGRYLRRDEFAPGRRGVNFDGAYSAGVREFFVQCVLFWLDVYRVDGVRLMGTETICDRSGVHFLEELSAAVEQYAKVSGRQCLLFAGNDRGNSRVVRSVSSGGYGMDSMLNQDFQQALHTAVTSESNGLYGDYAGLEELVSVLNRGVFFDGRYSGRLKRGQGKKPDGLAGENWVACTQNHVSIGNRAGGERMSSLVSFEEQKLIAGCLFLSPFIPMVFMGQEYGETRPFGYFTDFASEDASAAAVRERIRELRPYKWRAPMLSPAAEDTFSVSILNWEQRFSERGGMLAAFYTELMRMRRETPGLAGTDLNRCEARQAGRDVLMLLRHAPAARCKAAAVFNFGIVPVRIDFSGFLPNGEWSLALNSADEKWGGAGPAQQNRILCGECLELAPKSFCIYVCRGFC